MLEIKSSERGNSNNSIQERIELQSKEIKKLAEEKKLKEVKTLVFAVEKEAKDERLKPNQQLKHLKWLGQTLKSYLESNEPRIMDELKKNLKQKSEKLKEAFENSEKKAETFDKLWHKYTKILAAGNNKEAINYLRDVIYKSGSEYANLYLRRGEKSNMSTPLKLSSDQLMIFRNSLENISKQEFQEKGPFKLQGIQYLRDEKYGIIVAKITTNKGKSVISPLDPPQKLVNGKLTEVKNKKYPKVNLPANKEINGAKLWSILKEQSNLAFTDIEKLAGKKFKLKPAETTKELKEYQKISLENRFLKLQEDIKRNPDLGVSKNLRVFSSIVKIQIQAQKDLFNEWINNFSTSASISDSLKSIVRGSIEARKVDPEKFTKFKLGIEESEAKLKLVENFSKRWEKAGNNEREKRQIMAQMLMEGGPFKEIALRRLIALSNKTIEKKNKLSQKAKNSLEARGELLLRRKLIEENIRGKGSLSEVDSKKTFNWIKEASGKFCTHSVSLEGKKQSIFYVQGRSSLTLKTLNLVASEIKDKQKLLITSPQDFAELIPKIKELSKNNKFLKNLIGNGKVLDDELLRIKKVRAQMMFSNDPNERGVNSEINKIAKLKNILVAKIKESKPAWYKTVGPSVVKWLDNPVNSVGLLACAVGGGVASGAVRAMLRSGRLFKGVQGAELTTQALAGYQRVVAEVGELLISNAFATTASYGIKMATGQLSKNDSFSRDLLFGMSAEGIFKVRVLGKFITEGGAAKKLIGETINTVVNAGGLVGSEYLRFASENGKFANSADLAQLALQALTSKMAQAIGKHGGNQAHFFSNNTEKATLALANAGEKMVGKAAENLVALQGKAAKLSQSLQKGFKDAAEAVSFFKELGGLAKSFDKLSKIPAKARIRTGGRFQINRFL